MSDLTPNIVRPASPEQDRDAGTLSTWALLGWLVCVVIWLTWAPFAGRPASAAETTASPPGILDFAGNLLLFTPIVLVVMASQRRATLATWLVRVAAAALAASVTIEAGQHFMAGRVVSVRDVALNTAGALIAAALVGTLAARGVRVRRLVAPTAVIVFLGVVYHMGASTLFVARTFRLADWDPSFPIVSAEEAGGGRAYAGRVIDPRICGGSRGQAECVGPGADAAARQRVAEAAVREQRVAMDAAVISARDDQTGPARIVTFSGGTGERNATLAQDGQTIVVRLRTPLSGSNGSRIEFGLPGAARALDTTRVHAVFDRGVLTLVSEGGVRREARVRFGFLDSWIWARTIERVLPAHLLRARITGAIVFATPLLLFTFVAGRWLTRRVRRAHRVGGVARMP